MLVFFHQNYMLDATCIKCFSVCEPLTQQRLPLYIVSKLLEMKRDTKYGTTLIVTVAVAYPVYMTQKYQDRDPDRS